MALEALSVKEIEKLFPPLSEILQLPQALLGLFKHATHQVNGPGGQGVNQKYGKKGLPLAKPENGPGQGQGNQECCHTEGDPGEARPHGFIRDVGVGMDFNGRDGH